MAAREIICSVLLSALFIAPAVSCGSVSGDEPVPPREIVAGTIGSGDSVAGLAWSRDGKTLVCRVDLGIDEVRDFGGQKIRMTQVNSQQFRLIDVADGHVRKAFTKVGLGAMALAPDERLVARDERADAAGESTWAVTIRDAATGDEKAQLPETNAETTVVAFSPDGRTLATGDARGGALWDAATGRRIAGLAGSARPVDRAQFLPDGGSLVTSGSDGACRLWEARTGAAVRSFDGAGPFAVTADGRELIVWARRGEAVELRRYALATGRLLGAVEVVKGDAFDRICFSPDGALAAGVDAESLMAVTLWDTATGRAVRTLPPGNHPVWAIAISPDGRTLAAGGGRRNSAVRLWPLKQEESPGLDESGHPPRLPEPEHLRRPSRRPSSPALGPSNQ